MDFSTALFVGGSIEFITDEFVEALLNTVIAAPESWIAGVSHQFVGQCFRLLGLRFAVGVGDFNRTQDHPYRNDNPTYIFNSPPKLMNDARAFLKRLPVLLSRYADVLELDVENCRFHRLTHPVSVYLRVVRIWMKVVQSGCTSVHPGDSQNYLWEPLARMSFYILEGLSKLLPDLANFDGLRNICLSLAEDVRYGIFFEASSTVIVAPMLDMFEKHYSTFCSVEKSALDFVYCILVVVEEEPSSYIYAYEFLEAMLEKFSKSGERAHNNDQYLHLFTNELTTEKFICVIFETLKTSRSNSLLMAVLGYLITLETHLITADCFPIRFHELLLQVILRAPQPPLAVSSLAAQLYVKLALRNKQEKEVAQHILETYIKSQGNLKRNTGYAHFRNELGRYLKVLGLHFPALDRFESYTFLLGTRNVRIELSLIAAQSVTILFERLMAKYSTVPLALEEVNRFLYSWPNLLQVASHRTETRPILHSIYGMVDFVAVSQKHKELLTFLEGLFLIAFFEEKELSEMELHLIYSNMCRSVDVSGYDLIHTVAANTIREEQAQLRVLLNATDTEESQMVELLEKYAESLRRLHFMLMRNKCPVHQVDLFSIYLTLDNLLLEKRIQNDSLTRYGTESLAAMLILLYAELEEGNDEMGVRISMSAQKLLDFCKSELANSSVDLKRTKFLFCSCLILYVGNLPDLRLDDATYGTLLECLIYAPQALHSQSEGPLFMVYLAEMHNLFRQLIRWEELPNNRIWKVLIQYKAMPRALKGVDIELEKLLGVFIEHRIRGYVLCVPTILLHLSNEKTRSKNRVLNVLTAHLKVMEQHSSILDSWLLRLIVFQEVLHLLVRSMRVQRSEATSSAQENRLLTLQNVLPLLKTLCIQEEYFRDIAESMSELKEKARGPKEISEIETFITAISRFKYQCEDEHVAKGRDENFVGELIPLPPGPLNRWQHQALRLIENTDNIGI